LQHCNEQIKKQIGELQVEREGQSEEAHIEHEQLREEAEETRYQNGAKPQSS